MPHVAVVTSCTPNHLDWHATLQPTTRPPSSGSSPARRRRPGRAQHARSRGRLVGAAGSRPAAAPLYPLDRLPELAVRRAVHNRINAACAAAAAQAAALRARRRSATAWRTSRDCRSAWSGLPWWTAGGSTTTRPSTTPESTIAALGSLDEPVWLLAGGHDKGFDYSEMAATIAAGRTRRGLLRLHRRLAPPADDSLRTPRCPAPPWTRWTRHWTGAGSDRSQARQSSCRPAAPVTTSSRTSVNGAGISPTWSRPWPAHGRVGQGRKTLVGLRKPANRCSMRCRLQCVKAATEVPPESRQTTMPPVPGPPCPLGPAAGKCYNRVVAN